MLVASMAGFAGCLAAPRAGASLAIALPLAALAGLADGPVLAATLAIRQQCVPAHRYARVVASAASLKTGTFALGAAVAGGLATALTPRQLLLTVAVSQVLAVLPLLRPRLEGAAPLRAR